MEEITSTNSEKKPRYIEVEVLNELGETVAGKITELNEKMIQLYMYDDEHRGNQTLAYCTAYNLNPKVKREYDSARASSSRAFSKNDVIARIRFLMKKSSMDISEVLSNLHFLMTQKANKAVSLGASRILLNQYNLVNGLEKAKAAKGNQRGKRVTRIRVRGIEGRSKDIDD